MIMLAIRNTVRATPAVFLLLDAALSSSSQVRSYSTPPERRVGLTKTKNTFGGGTLEDDFIDATEYESDPRYYKSEVIDDDDDYYVSWEDDEVFGYDSDVIYEEMLEDMYGEDLALEEEEFYDLEYEDEGGEAGGDEYYEDVLSSETNQLDEGVEPLFSEKEEKLTGQLGRVETWVHDLEGNKLSLIALNEKLFGLPPRFDILTHVVLRQLKHKIQDEPYGSEDNNFIFFNKFDDPLFKDRPFLKPWIKQGLAWKAQPFTSEIPSTYGGISHMPIPHYHGTVPRKLRDFGVRALLSLKYRYNKLHVVDSLSSPYGYLQPEHFRNVLNTQNFKSVLMITGDRISPHFKTEGWQRSEPFPVTNPGTQRLWKTATETYACELREVEGLDVWSGLLYDTLILDVSCLDKLNHFVDTQTLKTDNINLRKSLEIVSTNVGKRHKMIRVVNMDNL